MNSLLEELKSYRQCCNKKDYSKAIMQEILKLDLKIEKYQSRLSDCNQHSMKLENKLDKMNLKLENFERLEEEIEELKEQKLSNFFPILLNASAAVIMFLLTTCVLSNISLGGIYSVSAMISSTMLGSSTIFFVREILLYNEEKAEMIDTLIKLEERYQKDRKKITKEREELLNEKQMLLEREKDLIVQIRSLDVLKAVLEASLLPEVYPQTVIMDSSSFANEDKDQKVFKKIPQSNEG